MDWTKIIGSEGKFIKQNEEGKIEIVGGLEGTDDLITELPKGLSHTQLIRLDHTHSGTDATQMAETSDPCILWGMMYTTNNPASYPQIYPYDANGESQSILGIPDPTSPTLRFPSPERINNLCGLEVEGIISPGEAGFFKLVRYDTTNNVYAIKLVETPIYCPNGIRLRSVGASNANARVAVMAKIEFFRAVDAE